MRPLLATLALLAAPAGVAHAQTCEPDPLADLQLTVAPMLAQVGETVQVTLTNLSADCTYTLPTDCLYTLVKIENCDGDVVLTVPCGGSPQPLPPGASVAATWDQQTGGGLQVPEGVWAFQVGVQAPTGQTGQLCAAVQVGASCASPFAYGAGTPGAGDHVPSLSTLGGAPSIGNADFQVAVTNGVGGATAVVLGSLAPAAVDLGFGPVVVDPGAAFLVSSFALSGTPGEPGQGLGFLPTPVPDAPALIGLELFFQGAVVDGAAGGGLALTQGVHAVICP